MSVKKIITLVYGQFKTVGNGSELSPHSLFLFLKRAAAQPVPVTRCLYFME
jgi:hypothetical protein